MAQRILFVCTGNTCRSAMAVYIAADIAEKQYPQEEFLFDSVGLFAANGQPATVEAQEVLAAKGIDMDGHRSKTFKEPMADKADLIIAMTQGHKQALLDGFPNSQGKTFTLGELSGSNQDVKDPYCCSREVYEKTAKILAEEISLVLDKAAKGHLPV